MLINTKHPCLPAIPLTDKRFAYQPAAATDVQATWARFGWTPPSKSKGRSNV